MRAGRLRHRITIREPDETVTAGGERTEGWTNVSTVWARIRPATVNEKLVGEKANITISHVVETRWQDSLFEPERQILFGARQFEITGVRDIDERGITALVDCIEVVE